MDDECIQELDGAMARLARVNSDIDTLKHYIYQLRAENRELTKKLNDWESGIEQAQRRIKAQKARDGK